MDTTTTACSDEKDLYKDVKFCKGKKSLPGARAYAYFIKKSNIVTWPTRSGSAAASLDAVSKLVGNFVLLADKKWSKLDLVPDQQHIQAEQVGKYGSKMFNNTFTLVVPGTEEEATGLATELNNDDVVFLVPQRNGKFRCAGNEDFTCNIAPSLDSGQGSDDTNATTLKITIEDEIAAPFYPGKIETNEGDISGADGKLITAVTP